MPISKGARNPILTMDTEQNPKQPTKIHRFPYPISFHTRTSVQGCVDILTAKLAYSLGFMLHTSVVLIILSRSSLPSVY